MVLAYVLYGNDVLKRIFKLGKYEKVNENSITQINNKISGIKIISNEENKEKEIENQKEREKFEGLGNNRNNKNNILNPLYGSAVNPIQLFNKAGGNKYGKVQLNPLGSNNMNINNNMNIPPPLIPNKKYKLASIKENDY